ncbi:transcriptional regulator [Novosphingobium huizhouense]|uniref:transcriptional regulator n=1 Tax=Novosphingobium huizhouense TaxID=2866625 RepID=UPI001CD89731|nr:YdaS family helix-turn-helix protein [Novosphingobium huizhouense]
MGETFPPVAALANAVEILGGQSATARLLKVSQPSVWKWLNGGGRLPGEHVLAIEAATGVPRHHLRPDIYPADLGPGPAWRPVFRGVDLGLSPVTCERAAVSHRPTFDRPAFDRPTFDRSPA